MSLIQKQLLIALILAFCLSGTAFSVNFQWLTDSAAQAFTDEDWKLLSDSLYTALDNVEDGGIQQWSNEVSGNSGIIEVSDTRQTAVGKCRMATISNRTKTQQGVSHLNLCQQADDEWKVDNRKQSK